MKFGDGFSSTSSGSSTSSKRAFSSGSIKLQIFKLLLLVPLLLLLCLPGALYFAYTNHADSIWSTKTLAGDNLLPTPWHFFNSPIDEKDRSWDKLSRIQCTYLSCFLDSSSSSSSRNSRAAAAAAPCPDFFQWIHEDLAPWRLAGISQHSVERARQFAAFRITIVNGRLYTTLYYKCVQSRAMFTIWGLLLLLERFPGQVPDVDFMFNCMDRPHFTKRDFNSRKSLSPPPPLFAYCSSKSSFDIPFPDWSYWGWAEVNVGPWAEESASIFNGSRELQWKDKRPAAQWKGNPHVGAAVRTDLLKCNKTENGAEIYVQDWHAEAREGFKNSKLSKQCRNRYKIYAEGHAWSVSFKYIMACGSPLLLINPEYYDFFMRGLLPQHHYWPINRSNLCPSIQNAVFWGNDHPEEAESIGNHAQDFLRKDLSMDHVYDYMLHLLQEYAKLQTFRPVVPRGAQLVCKSAILCLADPVQRRLLELTLNSSNSRVPRTCSMPRWNHTAVTEFGSKERKGFEAVKAMEAARQQKHQTMKN